MNSLRNSEIYMRKFTRDNWACSRGYRFTFLAFLFIWQMLFSKVTVHTSPDVQCEKHKYLVTLVIMVHKAMLHNLLAMEKKVFTK